MNITFWVTEKCNLACKYCYVHKQPKTMTLETAEQTIKYFTDKFDETVAAGKRINVALHGGEPLLNFDVIRYIVETLKERYDGHIIFTMTTNGTVFEKDIYDFIKGKVQISVSIDGNRTTNDTNRIYPNGESSFDKVMETLKFLKEQGEYIRVRMTVNKETLPAMAENYIYLDQMDMGVVTFALDAGAAWNQQDMQIYYENYEKIMDYMIENDKKAAQYLLFNIKEATFRRRTGCDGGTNTFHISADGGIYPCALAADKVDYWLGDVWKGLQPEKLEALHKINEIPVTGCGDCTFKQNCSSQVCKLINKAYTGDYYTVSAFQCNERDIVYRIYKKYKYILEGFHV